MTKGGFTLPGESGYEQLTLKLAERWEVIPCPVPLLDEERHFLLVYK